MGISSPSRPEPTTRPRLGIRLANEQDTEHQQLRKSISTPHKSYLWVEEDTIEFTPPLSDVVYGDGKALFGISTLHDRPAYWIIRGDSRWREDNQDWASSSNLYIENAIGEILENLLIEFGDAEPREDAEEDEEPPPYPAINLAGAASCFEYELPRAAPQAPEVGVGPGSAQPNEPEVGTRRRLVRRRGQSRTGS